jgi:hypothetical protein
MRLGSVFVLLFAVVPQILYLGRPLSDEQVTTAVESVPPGHEHHAQAAAEHANHCHVGPKGCAGSDGAVHVAQYNAPSEVIEHGSVASAVESAPLPQAFTLWHRPEKPPQRI